MHLVLDQSRFNQNSGEWLYFSHKQWSEEWPPLFMRIVKFTVQFILHSSLKWAVKSKIPLFKWKWRVKLSTKKKTQQVKILECSPLYLLMKLSYPFSLWQDMGLINQEKERARLWGGDIVFVTGALPGGLNQGS
jgi:hypothetical protein